MKKPTCECADPYCPTHDGISSCVRTGTERLFRNDMDDSSGTLMCDRCATDAHESGLFYVKSA